MYQRGGSGKERAWTRGFTARTHLDEPQQFAAYPDTLIMVCKTGFIAHEEAVKNITLFSKEVLTLREIKPVTVE